LKTLQKFEDFQAEYEGSIPFTRSSLFTVRESDSFRQMGCFARSAGIPIARRAPLGARRPRNFFWPDPRIPASRSSQLVNARKISFPAPRLMGGTTMVMIKRMRLRSWTGLAEGPG